MMSSMCTSLQRGPAARGGGVFKRNHHRPRFWASSCIAWFEAPQPIAALGNSAAPMAGNSSDFQCRGRGRVECPPFAQQRVATGLCKVHGASPLMSECQDWGWQGHVKGMDTRFHVWHYGPMRFRVQDPCLLVARTSLHTTRALELLSRLVATGLSHSHDTA